MLLSSFLRQRACILVLALSSLAACSPGAKGGEELKVEPANCEIAGKSFGIVGGDILSSDNDLSASTVMVLHIDYKDEVSTCTGTLIDNNKVLTAAHCTSPFGKKTVIAFTNNSNCLTQAPKRTLRLVTDEAIHPDYSYWIKSWDNAAHDLAILKFKGDIPTGYKVRELPTSDFAPSESDNLVMTGYGTTTEKGADSGTLRFTTAPASRLIKEFHLALNDSTVAVKNALILEQSDNGVCTGDSGGPLYINTERGLTLVGITSMGVDNKTRDEKNTRTCHGVALFTDVRAHLDWIQKKKNAL
ncbi:S1 family peptidase [Bdellovibrio sp.]|uniref:S1 family peptidase n=1 Tax=Bdellovibrio sp. TaxID=28201 RepID=UPI0039E53631